MNFRSILGLLFFISLVGLGQKAFAQCAGTQSMTITPPFPATGDCPPGQVYQFCYTMVGYTETGAKITLGMERMVGIKRDLVFTLTESHLRIYKKK
jgi:hypothetical protein